MMENYSLSDIKAVTDNGMNGFGDNGAFWLVLLFLFFGMNGQGFGGQGATASTQHEILLGQQFDRVEEKLDGIGKGICDSTYALNNSIKDCCCETRLGIAGLEAKIDQQTGTFTAMLKDMENQRLRDRISTLELNDAMCGVVRYPMQMSYATNCNPFGGCGCYQQNI